MKHVFGPVPSRRLGNSLGIDPIPSKYCNFGCVYCQLGETSYKTNTRQSFFNPKIILKEIKHALKKNEQEIDYVTFLASGEPLLCKDIGELINKTKKLTQIPICIITNGALLSNLHVQKAILGADVVMPTLDAGNEKNFKKINRPHIDIKYDKMINGLISFRKKYEGQIWMEIMLIKDVNDSRKELEEIKEKLDRINPDRVYINVPIRPPTQSWVKIPSIITLKIANTILKPYRDITEPEIGNFKIYSDDFESEFINIISRHPLKEEQLYETFPEFNKGAINKKLAGLMKNKKIKKVIYDDKVYWQYVP